jgi:hypothetical protein
MTGTRGHVISVSVHAFKEPMPIFNLFIMANDIYRICVSKLLAAKMKTGKRPLRCL